MVKTNASHHPGSESEMQRLSLLEARAQGDRENGAIEITKTYIEAFSVSVITSSGKPKHVLHALRRGTEPLGNTAFIKAMFAVLITVSVLIGAGVASIAVFGFEWKRFLTKSSTNKELAEDVCEPNTSEKEEV